MNVGAGWNLWNNKNPSEKEKEREKEKKMKIGKNPQHNGAKNESKQNSNSRR